MLKNDGIQFTGLGGTNEVGASSYLFSFPEARVLVDAGLRPSQIGEAGLPMLEMLKTQPPDVIVLTHAHLDHVGALPVVHKRFPGVPIYATRATRSLASEILFDAAKIGLANGASLYNTKDIVSTLNAIKEVGLYEPLEGTGVDMQFSEAGHILGAVSVMFQSSAGRVFHSADVNNVATLAAGGAYLPEVPIPVDALILESTYGDTILPSRKNQVRALIESVREVLNRGGRVLIPTFALGRAQELMLLLVNHMHGNLLPTVPIYLDGLVRATTERFSSLREVWPEALKNVQTNARQNPFERAPLTVVEDASHRTDILERSSPCIVLASSGMLSGGTSPIYAKTFLEEEDSALFVVGYQDAESPGRRLLELERGGEIQLPTGKKGSLETVRVLADVQRYYLSAHADRLGLINLASRYPEGKVILMHGEGIARRGLGEALSNSREVLLPSNGESVNLLERGRTRPKVAFIKQLSKTQEAGLSGEALEARKTRFQRSLVDVKTNLEQQTVTITFPKSFKIGLGMLSWT